MQIVFNDEFDKLTPEMWNLMERAADIALRTEFSELENIELENEPELGVTVVDDSEILELKEKLIPLNIIWIGHPAEEPEPRDQYDKKRIHYI
jgi:hypothetical protein